jgi:hypothetical protein
MVLLSSVDSMTTSLIFFLTTASFASKFLASKRLNAKSVMDVAFKIVNSIRGRSLQRQLFNLTLDEDTPGIICADNHLTNLCHRKENSSDVHCVLCGGNHHANYKEYMFYKELQKKTLPYLPPPKICIPSQLK